MLNGIHSFNQRNRLAPLPDRYWQLMRLLLPGVSAVKIFSYYALGVVQAIVNTLHPKLVVIRLNHVDDLPRLKELYDSRILWGIKVAVEILNEPNAPVEGFASWDDFLTRYLEAERFIRMWCPDWLICFPGMSPNFKPWWWWEQCQELIARADYLGLHLYYSLPGNIREQVWHLKSAKATFPNKPILVTEFCYTGGESGNVRPTSELAPEYEIAAYWLSAEGVDALFYYLLESDDPHWHEVGEVFDEVLARHVGQIKMEERTEAMDEATQTALIEMEARQNALLTQALIAFRKGAFTGAEGIDGIIVALTGKPLDFEPTYPKA